MKHLLSWTSLLLLTGCSFISSDEQQAALQTHNQLRAHHGSPALTWSHRLALYAGLHAATCRFEHSQAFGRYGQNLAAGYPSVSAAIRAWYSEDRLYSYANPRYSKATGHFTQLVWKSTTELGCAYVNCGGRHGTHGHYLVCNYAPPGNVINPGYFEKNVRPLVK